MIGFGQLIAQELNVIPVSTVRQLPDGWHKFTEQGARFDVEVLGGKLVKGNIIWFDSSSYSGSFAGNRISHGKGSMINSDGSKWSGKWKLNQKNGKGKSFDNEGAIVQQGIWEQNEYVGGAKKIKKKK